MEALTPDDRDFVTALAIGLEVQQILEDITSESGEPSSLAALMALPPLIAFVTLSLGFWLLKISGLLPAI